jgi:hypothetical protein
MTVAAGIERFGFTPSIEPRRTPGTVETHRPRVDRQGHGPHDRATHGCRRQHDLRMPGGGRSSPPYPEHRLARRQPAIDRGSPRGAMPDGRHGALGSARTRRCCHPDRQPLLDRHDHIATTGPADAGGAESWTAPSRSTPQARAVPAPPGRSTHSRTPRQRRTEPQANQLPTVLDADTVTFGPHTLAAADPVI